MYVGVSVKMPKSNSATHHAKIYTAVSTKVVLQKRKGERDNVQHYYG